MTAGTRRSTSRSGCNPTSYTRRRPLRLVSRRALGPVRELPAQPAPGRRGLPPVLHLHRRLRDLLPVPTDEPDARGLRSGLIQRRARPAPPSARRLQARRGQDRQAPPARTRRGAVALLGRARGLPGLGGRSASIRRRHHGALRRPRPRPRASAARDRRTARCPDSRPLRARPCAQYERSQSVRSAARNARLAAPRRYFASSSSTTPGRPGQRPERRRRAPRRRRRRRSRDRAPRQPGVGHKEERLRELPHGFDWDTCSVHAA